jgi:hypothetical protein
MNISASKDNSIQKFFVNNEFVTDAKKMADHFNLYFSNIASDIVKNVNPVADESIPIIPNGPPNDSVFSFSTEPVTISEISEAALALKDKATQDFMGLSSIFVKKKSFSQFPILLNIYLTYPLLLVLSQKK